MDVKGYLIGYNVVSAFLWGAVFARLAILYPLAGPKFVAGGLLEFTTWVQTLALLEVVHSLLGFVKSPLFTTLMQVSSRLFLVWIVLAQYPDVAESPIFSSMILAWSITEVIRYSYYAFNLVRDGRVPGVLVWLRYTAFIVLYPLGAGSECLLTYFAIPEAQAWEPWQALFFKAILLIYIPGFSVLFRHMFAQRRRIFKNIGKRKVDKKA